MIAPSLDYMDRAWDETRRGLPSSRPFSQMVIQSATDPTVAPTGRHAMIAAGATISLTNLPKAISTRSETGWPNG